MGNFFSPVLIFPQTGVSPLLNYSDSAVALPGNDKTLVLDSEPGLEHLILLYAKRALDILAIMRRFEENRGTVEERLAKAVGRDLLLTDEMNFDEGEAHFSGETGDSKAVAALILTIDHR
jgi:hypothetical protein